jgi:hypothetical protein
MEKNEKVYMANQLNCMLPPSAVKVMFYVLSWQSQGDVKYYEKQFSTLLHMTKGEVEVAIQTLIDSNLLAAELRGDIWYLILKKDVIKKYFDVPMQKVHDHPGFNLSMNVTWNSTKKEEEAPADTDNISEQQLQALIMKLQIQLNENQQVQQLVRQMAAPAEKKFDDGLPF